jgi:hypothetical protein
MSALDEYRTKVIERGRCHINQVFLGWTDRTGELRAKLDPCHANLSHIARKRPTYIFTSLWYNNEGIKSLAKEFWEFILDERRSPWRSILGGSTIIRGDDGYPVGVALDARNPAQVVGNLCIATRIPTENHNTLLTWKAYMDAGFDAYEALACANLLTMTGCSTQYTSKWNHYPFTVGDTLDVSKLRMGTPKVTNPDLSDGGMYTPCNVIWTKASSGLYLKVQENRTYDGMFGKYFRYHVRSDGTVRGTVSFRKSVAIFMENRDKL